VKVLCFEWVGLVLCCFVLCVCVCVCVLGVGCGSWCVLVVFLCGNIEMDCIFRV